jgi:asparagine synthase (glutamine-hydrolysing)
MSGFFGMLRADGQEISREFLQRIAQLLHSRGSTGEAIWIERGVGTCFSYLDNGSEKQSNAQPVRLGGNWVLGDIRLDAREELMRQLAGRKESLASDAPGEQLLLHAWKCWGDASLQRMIGDFAFALYEEKERTLWCARDFVGPRPFYYAQTGGIFYFSNTLAALRLAPQISSELDEAFVADFLIHGYCTDLARTVYAGIKRLPPGHILRFQEQSVEVRPFLRLPVEEPLRFSKPAEYVDAYREVLRQAVQDRLPQASTALYLSGGLDSGSVCAVASKIASEDGKKDRLKAFTISWRPLFEDPEPHFATLTAQHLELRHEILEDQTFQPFATRESERAAAPEPNIDAFFSRAQQHQHRIAAHSNVILSGDGGDDVLTGQSGPYFRKLWSAGEWPEIARTVGSFFLANGTLPPLRMGLRGKLRRWFHKKSKAEDTPDWLDPEFARRNHLQKKWEARDTDSSDSAEHPIHPQAYAALHGGFWSSILEGEDAGFTHVPLETRAPFLDLRVLRFLLRLPPVPWCVNKELMRRAMQGELPDVVRVRPKSPLLEDPLEACLRTGRWTPTPPASPPSAIHNYLDWKKWSATLNEGAGFSCGSNLFSLALVLWLKDIENAEGIE